MMAPRPDDDDNDNDPTVIPPGVKVVTAEEDDSDEADQGGGRPDDAVMEQLHGVAWTAAQEAQDAGIMDELLNPDGHDAPSDDPMDD